MGFLTKNKKVTKEPAEEEVVEEEVEEKNEEDKVEEETEKKEKQKTKTVVVKEQEPPIIWQMFMVLIVSIIIAIGMAFPFWIFGFKLPSDFVGEIVFVVLFMGSFTLSVVISSFIVYSNPFKKNQKEVN